MEYCYTGEMIIKTAFFESISGFVLIGLGLLALARGAKTIGLLLLTMLIYICVMLLAFMLLEVAICSLYDFIVIPLGKVYLVIFSIISLVIINKPTDPAKILPTKNVVVDGNNVLGRADWQFTKLVDFHANLLAAGIKPMLIFDNTIYRNLKENNLIVKGQTIQESLAVVFSCSIESITVSKINEKADPLIIQYAVKNKCAVISRDQFNKEEDRDYLQEAKSLKKSKMIYGVKILWGALVIDGQPKRNKILVPIWVAMLILLIVIALLTSYPFEP